MPLLTKKQVDTAVLWYFAIRGRFPSGTTKQTWKAVTMAQMEFDDPPLVADPHFEKKKISNELNAIFNGIGIKVNSSLPILKAATKTMADLSENLHGSQQEMEVIA